MKNASITLKAIVMVLCMASCSSNKQQGDITEANYLHEDSVLWSTFEKDTEKLVALRDSMPSKSDSILEVYNAFLEEGIRKNVALALKYASTPSGFRRLFMTRNLIAKDTLKAVFNSLSEDLQKSEVGLNIKAHLETEQLSEGDTLFLFPCKDKEGVPFDWEVLKGKQVLLLYGGLGCMGSQGRENLKQLYNRTSRNDLEIVIFWPSNTLNDLNSVINHYAADDYLFISDFKQDASPMKIKYGCQATPTCFLTDKNHVIVVKSEGLDMNRIETHIE